MPGSKTRRQALRPHTPVLSHPGEGIELVLRGIALLDEKIDSL
jgi:hypothetical protein